MKKIIILCSCIMLVLLLSFADGNVQKKRGRQTFSETESERILSVEDDETGVIAVSKVEEEKEEKEERNIRVLIKTAGYLSEYHTEITVSSEGGFSVSDGMNTWKADGDSEHTFRMDGNEFSDSEILYLKSFRDQFHIYNLQRDRESTVYEGTLEIRRLGDGLLLINELPLEKYLCGVVPSEMPSSYPKEALKAQAVCARTYAAKRMQEQSASAFFADVDDSVSYQVYNNQERTAQTDAAVAETAGQVLENEEGLAETLYYSTSCGLDLQMDLSKEAVFAAFLEEDHIKAYEAGEPWYRWQTDIRLESLGDVAGLLVEERIESGRAEKLLVTKNDGTQYSVVGEYEIRSFLAGANPVVTLQSGETMENLTLLPSAFFILQPRYQDESLYGYHVLGGGYGHGNGMSQNGAKQMALEGLDYQEILQNYYLNAKIK